jgi:hypothetical protein
MSPLNIQCLSIFIVVASSYVALDCSFIDTAQEIL